MANGTVLNLIMKLHIICVAREGLVKICLNVKIQRPVYTLKMFVTFSQIGNTS